MKKTLIALAALSLTAQPLLAASHGDMKKATANIIGTNGDQIGTAEFTQGPHGVVVYLRVEGLTPGKHGMHLHATGSCTTESNFTSAEGHVGLIDGGHGLLNPEGPEAGDMPNLFVAENGVGEMEAFNQYVSLNDGDQNLLDDNGSALIIHEAGDDHMTQPIGGAGARVACGVIEPAS